MIKNAEFTSVWDGCTAITTSCKVNTKTRQIFDIENEEDDNILNNIETLDEEYVTIDGTKYPAVNTFNDPDEIAHSAGYYWYSDDSVIVPDAYLKADELVPGQLYFTGLHDVNTTYVYIGKDKNDKHIFLNTSLDCSMHAHPENFVRRYFRKSVRQSADKIFKLRDIKYARYYCNVFCGDPLETLVVNITPEIKTLYELT